MNDKGETTMNEIKQIEEMSRDMCPLSISCDECIKLAEQMRQSREQYCKPMQYAKKAYAKGYRKIIND